MRLKLTWISTFVLILLIASCQSESDTEPEITNSTSRLSQVQQFNPAPNQKEANQLIIKFKPTTIEFSKASVRKTYNVDSFSRCNCNQNSIELWQFNPDSIGKGGIEEIKTIVNTEPDLESADFAFDLALDTSTPVSVYNNIASKVKMVNTGVTIAVIDSGIDPTLPGITGRYLYNSSLSRNCNLSSPSGWDFVENDHLPQDQQGHGSIVAAIIAEELDAANIDFQILPVKAFGSDGRGSLFNISCALQYAINNSEVDIINMSFGWYVDNSEIIGNLLNDAGLSKVLITSAGNKTNNNDFLPHFPSGYGSPNLVSIAAHDTVAGELASYSNFGFHSVDLVAPGSFDLPNLEEIVNGTSFSAAFVSAKCAKIVSEYPDASDPIISQLIWAGTYQPDLVGLVKYPYSINP
ncbi:MAG: S8 family serine peptidase [Bacteroidota bacterium]